MADALIVRKGSVDNKVYLYNNGIVNTALIGSFVFTGAGCGYLTDTIRTLTSNDSNGYSITTANTISGSYTKLCIEFKYVSPYAYNNGYHSVEQGVNIKYLGILKNNNTTVISNQIITQSVDFVGGTKISIKGYNVKAEISKIWLE